MPDRVGEKRPFNFSKALASSILYGRELPVIPVSRIETARQVLAGLRNDYLLDTRDISPEHFSEQMDQPGADETSLIRRMRFRIVGRHVDNYMLQLEASETGIDLDIQKLMQEDMARTESRRRPGIREEYLYQGRITD